MHLFKLFLKVSFNNSGGLYLNVSFETGQTGNFLSYEVQLRVINFINGMWLKKKKQKMKKKILQNSH